MITAKEAKQKSDSTLGSFAETELAKIEKEINKAIERGEYSIPSTFSLKPKVKQELERLGYKVTTSTDSRDNWSMTYISWEKA